MSARSAKWGLNERKTFPTEQGATNCAREIEKRLFENGKQPDVPKEKPQSARSYEKLIEKLAAYSRTPEEAIDHFQRHLADEIAKQAKPFIRDLADDWKAFKYADTTLSKKTLIEIRPYARFIKSKWGDLKPDDLKKRIRRSCFGKW